MPWLRNNRPRCNPAMPAPIIPILFIVILLCTFHLHELPGGGVWEAMPPQDLHFSGMVAGFAGNHSRKERFLEGIRPLNLPNEPWHEVLLRNRLCVIA